MKILGLDHISVATNDLEKHIGIIEKLFDLKDGGIEENAASKIRLSFLNLGNTHLEFIQPLDENSAISKFLQRRGPGIHHICLRVENIDRALDELKAKNVRLIDDHPKQGAEGSKIAFIHPESAGGILIELKEAAG
jgi:methylmalonyl-CoA/ethylmalonyl-CoA epimerase